MIGFYNYSVILTYIGLVSSVFGITQVFENHMSIAFLCLLLSGICDLFDGKIARSMKNNKTEQSMKRCSAYRSTHCATLFASVFSLLS